MQLHFSALSHSLNIHSWVSPSIYVCVCECERECVLLRLYIYIYHMLTSFSCILPPPLNLSQMRRRRRSDHTRLIYETIDGWMYDFSGGHMMFGFVSHLAAWRVCTRYSKKNDYQMSITHTLTSSERARSHLNRNNNTHRERERRRRRRRRDTEE